jgi:hypothetical protein
MARAAQSYIIPTKMTCTVREGRLMNRPLGIPKKIDERDYYDFLPPNIHRTGDIWKALPTFGTLNCGLTAGIVMTPACDLANNKSETITYIPIVSITDYLNSPAFYVEIWSEIKSILEKSKMGQLILPPDRFELPTLDDIDTAIALTEQSHKKGEDKANILRLGRCRLYIEKNERGENYQYRKYAPYFPKDDCQRS